jgi:hypothetical protein
MPTRPHAEGSTKRTRAPPGARPPAMRCRRKFLSFFPDGFADEMYVDSERAYKWRAHEAWEGALNERAFAALLKQRRYSEIAQTAVRIESRTNLIFSYEKMALRDAVRETAGARVFAHGLHDLLYGSSDFDAWCAAVANLPRPGTRVLTWPIATVFGFIAQPKKHLFVKPTVTKLAARAYGFDYRYNPRPSAAAYASALAFAGLVKREQEALKPRDMIDAQGFIWVMGSDEYA